MAKISELKKFIPKLNDHTGLTEEIAILRSAVGEDSFWNTLVEKLETQDGKEYLNGQNMLPDGIHCEYKTNFPRSRIVVDVSTLDLYVAKDHYQNVFYAGKPEFLENKR
jgi:hypothetical protein